MESRTFSTPFILQLECGGDILLFGHDGVSALGEQWQVIQSYEIQIIICDCLLWGKERIRLSDSYRRIGTSNCVRPHEGFMMTEEHPNLFLVSLQFISPLTDAGLVQSKI
jgi:hypothetical protein